MGSMHTENSDYLFMVEQAVLAPSGHNTQPWLFKINESSIEIHPNFEKSLPIVDFDNRELFIALGCAAENLCIAASHKKYESVLSINDSGTITINLTKQELINANLLFEQIPLRQTNRSIYSGRVISEDIMSILKAVDLAANINMYFYKNGTKAFYDIANYVFKGNAIQMQDKAFKQELRGWMRYNKKHQNKTNDGLSYAVFGAPNLPMFVSQSIMTGLLNEKLQNKADKKKIESSSHFIVFTTQNNTIAEWINLGRTLERFLLKLTELGIVHAYMNQPNEVQNLSKEVVKSLHIPDEFAAILLRVGYGRKMPYSKRKDINEVLVDP